MKSVGRIASGVRQRLAQGPLAEHPRAAHAVTSCTSPSTRSRVRPVASRNTSSSVGSASSPRRSRSSSLSARRRALADDAPVVDDRQPVAELVGLLQVLRGEEDRRAARVDAAHLVPHGEAARGVEAGGRLVEEEDLGPVDERRREVEAPLHAAGVALDEAVGGVLAARPGSSSSSARSAASRGARPKSRACRTSSSRPVWRGSSPASCSATPMLRRAASGSAARRRRRRARSPEVIVSSVREHADRRRLAGAVGPEEPEDLAGLDPQVDAAHRLDDAGRGPV